MSGFFIIPIAPTAQKRPRACVRGRHAMAYKDKGQRDNEQTIETFLAQHQPALPLDGPVLLGVKAFMPIPKSMPRRKAEAAEAGSVRPTSKPDLDNLVKQIKDCMTRMGYWRDDAQVVGFLETGKFYSTRPRWEITVGLLAEGVAKPWPEVAA